MTHSMSLFWLIAKKLSRAKIVILVVWLCWQTLMLHISILVKSFNKTVDVKYDTYNTQFTRNLNHLNVKFVQIPQVTLVTCWLCQQEIKTINMFILTLLVKPFLFTTTFVIVKIRMIFLYFRKICLFSRLIQCRYFDWLQKSFLEQRVWDCETVKLWVHVNNVKAGKSLNYWFLFVEVTIIFVCFRKVCLIFYVKAWFI